MPDPTPSAINVTIHFHILDFDTLSKNQFLNRTSKTWGWEVLCGNGILGKLNKAFLHFLPIFPCNEGSERNCNISNRKAIFSSDQTPTFFYCILFLFFPHWLFLLCMYMHYLFVFFHNLSKKHTNCLGKSITRQIGLLFYLYKCFLPNLLCVEKLTILCSIIVHNIVTHRKKNFDKFGARALKRGPVARLEITFLPVY